MLHHWLTPLSEQYEALGFLRLFGYITFRAAGGAVTGFLVTALAMPWFIRRMRRMGVVERTTKTDSEEVARQHAYKDGTPTMGGVLVVAGIVLGTLLWARLDSAFVTVSLGVVVSLAGIGALDDWIKLKVEGRPGISRRFKLFGQTLVAAWAAGVLWWYFDAIGSPAGTSLHIPFAKDLVVALPGWAWFAVIWCVVVGSSNAVNLTDGLDGLAVGLTVPAAAAFAAVAYIVARTDFTAYLGVPHIPGAGEQAVHMAVAAGACLGFLWWNCHPASIFLGDTGALALGGLLGMAAVITKQELTLFLVGGVFVAEAASVILQVWWFRRTGGRRIFLCAPLHHHFRFKGWSEPQTVVRLWIVGALLALAMLATLKIR